MKVMLTSKLPKKKEEEEEKYHLDYIGEDGYVYKHNGEKYYKTGIFLQGPKGNPGPKGRDGLTPNIGLNGNWYIGGKDTLVKATSCINSTVNELKELIDNNLLVPGITYSYNVTQNKDNTIVTVYQVALSPSKLDNYGYITSTNDKYNNQEINLDINNIGVYEGGIPDGIVAVVEDDWSKLTVYQDGIVVEEYHSDEHSSMESVNFIKN